MLEAALSRDHQKCPDIAKYPVRDSIALTLEPLHLPGRLGLCAVVHWKKSIVKCFRWVEEVTISDGHI